MRKGEGAKAGLVPRECCCEELGPRAVIDLGGEGVLREVGGKKVERRICGVSRGGLKKGETLPAEVAHPPKRPFSMEFKVENRFRMVF